MKNLFLALAFLFVWSVGFSANIPNLIDLKHECVKYDTSNSDFDIKVTYTFNDDGACTILHVVLRKDGSQMGSFTLTAPDNHPDCGGVIYHMTNFPAVPSIEP